MKIITQDKAFYNKHRWSESPTIPLPKGTFTKEKKVFEGRAGLQTPIGIICLAEYPCFF